MRILSREEQIRHMLSCFRISFSNHGHSCLTIAIELVCNGVAPGRMLYEKVAEAKKSSCSRVCANIRTAIRQARKQGGPLYSEITGRDATDALPHTSEFIAACAVWTLTHEAVLDYDSRVDGMVVEWREIAPSGDKAHETPPF